MKRIIILFVTILLSFETVSSAQTAHFQDVPGHYWAYEAIEKAYQAGIVQGTFSDAATGRKYFSPDSPLTGAEFLTILGRAFYQEEMKAFEKNANTWDAPAIELTQKYNLLYQAGGINNIHKPINRYEMAAIICNVLTEFGIQLPSDHELAVAGATAEIADYDKIPGTHNRKNVATVFHFGILSGIDNVGTFAGERHTTRAEITVIYQKLAEYLRHLVDVYTLNSNPIPLGSASNTADKQREEFTEEVLRLVNAEREKAKLAPLKKNAVADGAAKVRAKEIAKVFSHTRPDGKDTFTVLTDAGITYRTAGENIAAGYSTPKEVVEGWMKSKGHRANILSDQFTEIGIAYTDENTEFRHYWVQLFLKPKE